MTPQGQLLLGRRSGLDFAGLAEDEEAPLFVGEVDVAARVDEDFFGLLDELRFGHDADAVGGLRRDELANFL